MFRWAIGGTIQSVKVAVLGYRAARDSCIIDGEAVA